MTSRAGCMNYDIKLCEVNVAGEERRKLFFFFFDTEEETVDISFKFQRVGFFQGM